MQLEVKFFKMHGVSLALMAVSALALAVCASAAVADNINVTEAAGHPPVFRWVKQFPEAVLPSATASLEALGHSLTASEQYGEAIAGVGEELEAI